MPELVVQDAVSALIASRPELGQALNASARRLLAARARMTATTPELGNT